MTSPIGTDEELIERAHGIAFGLEQDCRTDAADVIVELSDALQSRISEVERLNNLLSAGTLSLTSFDGHCVRIDFSSREEAEQLFDALSQHDGIAPGTNEG